LRSLPYSHSYHLGNKATRRCRPSHHRPAASLIPPFPPINRHGHSPEKPKTTDEQFAELCTVIDNLTSSMATMQGNQDQLTVAVNHLHLEKVGGGDGKDPQANRDPIASAATNCSPYL
jgi:hypothetical protein